LRALDELSPLSPETLLEQRYAKFRHMGQFFT
jgi:acetyl-CoA carboxylase alpha subunit